MKGYNVFSKEEYRLSLVYEVGFNDLIGSFTIACYQCVYSAMNLTFPIFLDILYLCVNNVGNRQLNGCGDDGTILWKNSPRQLKRIILLLLLL